MILLPLLTAALFLAVSSHEDIAHSWPTYPGFVDRGGNCPGNTIFPICYNCELQLCVDRCQSHPQCLGFSYSQDNHSCWGKSASCFAPDKSKPGIHFYEKPGFVYNNKFPKHETFQLEEGDNCRDNVLWGHGCINCGIKECVQKCEELPDCVGVSWQQYDWHCFPKSGTCNEPFKSHLKRFYRRPGFGQVQDLPSLPSLADSADISPFGEELHSLAGFVMLNGTCAARAYPRAPECDESYCGLDWCGRKCRQDSACQAFLFIGITRLCSFKYQTCQTPLTLKKNVAFYRKIGSPYEPRMELPESERKTTSYTKRTTPEWKRTYGTSRNTMPTTRRPTTRYIRPAPPVTRAPVTRPPVTRPPVIRAPVTRAPVTRAPVLAVTFPAGVFRDIDGYQQLYGNCPGFTISRAGCEGDCTVRTCGQECVRMKDCKGFSFIKPELSCLLKSKACADPLPNDDVHFYRRLGVSGSNIAPATRIWQPTITPRPPVVITTRPPAPSEMTSDVFTARRGNCPGNTLSEAICNGDCTALACQYECTLMEKCAGFSFIKSKLRCLFKTASCADPIANDDVTFYERKTSAQPAEVTPVVTSSPDVVVKLEETRDGFRTLGGNCPGNTLKEADCGDKCQIGRCTEECSRNKECKGFSYLKSQQRCILKKASCTDPSKNSEVSFYVKTTEEIPAPIILIEPPRPGPALDGNCPGNTIGDAPCDRDCSPTVCFNACNANDVCEGFSYIKSAKRCLLKSKACDQPKPNSDVTFYKKTKGETRTDSSSQATVTIISGAGTPQSAYEELNGNCRGNTLRSHDCSVTCTVALCGDACTTAGAECKGFSFVKSRSQCLLKTKACVPDSDNADVQFHRKIAGDSIVTTKGPTPIEIVAPIAVVQSNSKFSNVPDYVQYPGNCPGNSYANARCDDACTVQLCADQCRGSIHCAGFSFIASRNSCSMKLSGCKDPKPNEDVRFYAKQLGYTPPVSSV